MKCILTGIANNNNPIALPKEIDPENYIVLINADVNSNAVCYGGDVTLGTKTSTSFSLLSTIWSNRKASYQVIEL